jgi:hypothetical protein
VNGHLATTNVYAEVDLEMKAKALTRCEEEEEGQGLRIDFVLEVLILYYLPSHARLRVVVGMLRGPA